MRPRSLLLAVALVVGTTASGQAEAAPAGPIGAVLDPVETLLPAAPMARPRVPGPTSAVSCLLDREPRRACRSPEPRRPRPRAASGRVLRYRVHVGAGVALDRRDVASTVDGILADPKGWGGSGEVTFRRAASGPLDFRIVLALPGAVDRLCFPLRTRRALSCATGKLVVLNVLRWRHGAPAFHGDVELYRRYLVNHEVGHVLGHGHASCPRAGARAPVMMQQTKGVGACRANGRPLAWERG